jgi:GNAT superfamily N-acetyltransferase
MRWDVRPAAELSADEKQALRTLTAAVYPPDGDVAWPGRAIEWAAPHWSVIGSDAAGAALCHVGVLVRKARWNERGVHIGGIGGVKTHPAARRQGLATEGMRRAVDFFRQRGDLDFGLLVCEPRLVPFYEGMGWRPFPGKLLVTQGGATVPFTFNLPMTTPLGLQQTLAGTIDLLGPPW